MPLHHAADRLYQWTLIQGHRDGCQKIFPRPQVNHVWFEAISFIQGFSRKVGKYWQNGGGGGNGPKTISPQVTQGDLNILTMIILADH